MTRRLFFVFIATILLDGFILLSFSEMKENFLLPVFLIIMMLVLVDYKSSIIAGTTLSIIGEVASGLHFGTVSIPFLLTLLLYVWFSSFLNLKAIKFYPEGSLFEFTSEIISAAGLTYIFYVFSFLTENILYKTNLTWHQWILIFYNSRTLSIIGIEAVVVLLILKYFRIKKNITITSRYA